MRRFAAALLISLAALPSTAGDPPAKSPWETVRGPAQDYFNAADAAGRAAAMEKMKAGGLADAKLTKAQAESAEKMALAGNTKARGKSPQYMIDVEASDGKHPVFIHVAPGARPSSPSPLIIALHGGGNVSDYESEKAAATEMMSWFAKYADASGAITIFPGSTNWDTTGMEAMWKGVEHVQENYNIDPNHVMVYGGSMGGFGTGTAASQKPTFFAMAAPFLGCVDLSSRAADFRNLPFYVVIGELDMEMCNKPAKATVKALKDAGCDVTFKELQGKGHEVAPKEFPEFIAKFAKAKRDMFAKKLGRAAGSGRWYWLDAAGPLEAEISGQTITIKGPSSATVYLSDRMMDLEQPVKVVVNGETKFEGKVERSFAVMMNEIDATGDRGRTYVAKIEAK